MYAKVRGAKLENALMIREQQRLEAYLRSARKGSSGFEKD